MPYDLLIERYPSIWGDYDLVQFSPNNTHFYKVEKQWVGSGLRLRVWY